MARIDAAGRVSDGCFRKFTHVCNAMSRGGFRPLMPERILTGRVLRYVSILPINLFSVLIAVQAMAFGSLMLEGNDVRISGQDVGRGTFSQR